MTSGFNFSPVELSLFLLKTSRRTVARRKVLGQNTYRRQKMSPGLLAPEPTFEVKEMEKSAKEKHNFGAVIQDIDLDALSGMFDRVYTCCSKGLTFVSRCRCESFVRCHLDT
jgi:hypothetical protein